MFVGYEVGAVERSRWVISLRGCWSSSRFFWISREIFDITSTSWSSVCFSVDSTTLLRLEKRTLCLQNLPRIAASQLRNILQDMPHPNLQSLSPLLDEIKVQIANLFFRRKVEDFDLQMLLSKLLLKLVEVAVALEDRPTLRALLRPQVDLVEVKILRFCLLEDSAWNGNLEVDESVDLGGAEKILQSTVFKR
jgi:hypothetical protein